MWKLVVVVSMLSGTAQAQSLGDIARSAEKARSEKKEAQQKVYTNKDLKDEPSTPFVVPPDSPPTSPASPPSASVTPTTPVIAPPADYRQSSMKDEAYWKGRVQVAQAALDTDQLHLDAMIARVRSLSEDFNASQSISQRMVLRHEREAAATETTRLQAAVKADHKALVVIEEEARRIGVPAGWLRP